MLEYCECQSVDEMRMMAPMLYPEVTLYLRWKTEGYLPVRYFCDLPCNLADVYWKLDQEARAKGYFTQR